MNRRRQVGLSVNYQYYYQCRYYQYQYQYQYSMKRRGQVGLSSGRRGSLVPLPGEEGDAHLG